MSVSDETATTTDGIILSDAADELATLIETTRVLVGFGDHDVVPVSYSGGMFTDDAYLDQFRAALQRLPAKYDLRLPVLDPALGAAVYAAKHSGHPMNPDALQRLSTTTSTDEANSDD